MSEFAPGSLGRVEVGNHPFAVAIAADGKPYVIDDLCTHANARLSDGWLEEGCVACPWHGAQFDLETGEALSLPARVAVKTYPVIVKDGVLFIDAEMSGEGLDEAHLDR